VYFDSVSIEVCPIAVNQTVNIVIVINILISLLSICPEGLRTT
jgi:hypothetical protein